MLEPYEYKEYLDSYAWKALKKSKLKDNPQCEICWSEAITVHHLSYTRLWKEKENDIVSICDSCHYKCHFDEWKKIPINTRSLTKRFNILKEEKIIITQSKFNNNNEFDKDYDKYHDNGNNDFIEILVLLIFIWFFFINKISKSWLWLTLSQVLFWLGYIFLVIIYIPKIYLDINKNKKSSWTFVWFYLIICLFVSFYLFEYIFKTSPF